MRSYRMSLLGFRSFLVSLLVVSCSGYSDQVATLCRDNGDHGCDTSKGDCSRTNNSCTGEYCFASWTNKTTGLVIHRGCWIANSEKCDNPRCELAHQPNDKLDEYYFCCCNGNFCNVELTMAPRKPTDTNNTLPEKSTSLPYTKSETTYPPSPHGRKARRNTINTLLYSVVPIFGFAVVLVCGFFMYHKHRTAFSTRVCEEEPLNAISPPSPVLSLRPIQLVEVISQGQFGTVWRANYLQDVVAVKVFSLGHKAAWATETEFYTSCNMKNENILKFVAVEKHTDGQYTEFWLVTQYHENGSLADYLKGHVVSWQQLCSMAGSMALGLAYLHSEILGTSYKPCIAHRDFKSKNVLVKKDLSCCLSDFGLAMKFEPGGDPGETHGQVGTRRYMAPEVLEGAINFTRESFLRIDMYAFALVLWEVTSRCTASDGPVDDYRLPFDDEVGAHPSLEDMQQVVVQKKIRPEIRPDWHVHAGMASLVETVDECWDQDAEARLTAQCVVERVAQLNTLTGVGLEHTPAVTTVINHTEMSTSSKESTI